MHQPFHGPAPGNPIWSSHWEGLIDLPIPIYSFSNHYLKDCDERVTPTTKSEKVRKKDIERDKQTKETKQKRRKDEKACPYQSEIAKAYYIPLNTSSNYFFEKLHYERERERESSFHYHKARSDPW